MPAKAGIHRAAEPWIPNCAALAAFKAADGREESGAGMTPEKTPGNRNRPWSLWAHGGLSQAAAAERIASARNPGCNCSGALFASPINGFREQLQYCTDSRGAPARRTGGKS